MASHNHNLIVDGVKISTFPSSAPFAENTKCEYKSKQYAFIWSTPSSPLRNQFTSPSSMPALSFPLFYQASCRACLNSNANSSHSFSVNLPPNDMSPRFIEGTYVNFTGVEKPPRPRRIILVRHGQSEGNVDESAYTRVADPKIALTHKGMAEAETCGINIREMIEADGASDWKVYFYVSPYRRTLETLRNLAKAFPRSRIAGVREEPRLREQDFGNFQDSEKMQLEKAKRALYGRFFYRFPDGESAADVYDRITGFRETLRADIDLGRFQPPDQRSPNLNVVIVSHGLTLRIFLMRWYKWTVSQFERLHNFGNAGMVVMERGYGGRYSLLMHHTEEELRKFGLTDQMLLDQEWQKHARPGEVNYNCELTGPSYFTHFDDEDSTGYN